jgi:myosin-5
MCAARESAPELKEFNLDSPMKFEYTSQGGDPEIDGVDDLKEFNYTKEAFRLLKFSDKEQINIFRILAGILHLGNVKFESGSGRADSESCSIRSSDESLHNFAQLFEIEEDQMKKWLCNRKIVTTRETYTKPIGAESVSKHFKFDIFCGLTKVRSASISALQSTLV